MSLSIFIHEYIFPLHSSSYTLTLYPPPSQWYQPPGRTCFTFLFFAFEKQNKTKRAFLFVCLRELYREFPCDMSMYICIVTQIGSCPLFFSFLHQLPSYGD
jgi:hypothetical protein